MNMCYGGIKRIFVKPFSESMFLSFVSVTLFILLGRVQRGLSTRCSARDIFMSYFILINPECLYGMKFFIVITTI